VSVDLFKRRFGLRQGRVIGHLAQLTSDLCIVLGQVGLACASRLDASRRIFFGLGWGFLASGQFFWLCQVLGQKSWPTPRLWIVVDQ
jgi:hypothetical protein